MSAEFVGSNFFGRFHRTEIGWKSILVGKTTILVKLVDLPELPGLIFDEE
jgi:hypothetical protein